MADRVFPVTNVVAMETPSLILFPRSLRCNHRDQILIDVIRFRNLKMCGPSRRSGPLCSCYEFTTQDLGWLIIEVAAMADRREIWN